MGTLQTSTIVNADLADSAAIARSKLASETKVYPVSFTEFRVWDNATSLMVGTAATDDLAIIEGTFGTDSFLIKSGDAGSTTVTQRALCEFAIPPEYENGNTATLRIAAKMETVSDGTATVDAEMYAADRNGSVGADLITTAATTINSATWANKDFTINTTINPGDLVQLRITVAITDSATPSGVIANIGAVEFRLDVRG